MERSRNFTKYGFPVDYFWLDLPYTNNGNYLDFNKTSFPEMKKLQMESEIKQANRRIVIIADPHVLKSPVH